MIIKKKLSSVFVGWWMNLVTGISSGLGTSFYGYGMSVMFKPLAEDLGLGRAAVSWASGIGRLLGAAEAPLTGWLSDRFGPRWVIVGGSLVLSLGLWLMFFVHSIWSYNLVWGVIIAIGSNMALTIAVDKALADWFIRQRGRALGIRFVLIGSVGVVSLPIVTWLVNGQGWRMTCVIWGLVMLATVPFVWIFVKQKRPEFYGLLPDGARLDSEVEAGPDSMIDRGVEYASGYDETEFTLRQALRTPAYWLMTIAWVLVMLVVGSMNIHMVPFLTDMGISPTAAGNMMALMVFFTIPSRFIGGVLADRVKKDRIKYLVAASFLALAVGIIAFMAYQNIITVYILLIMFGFGSGAPTPLRLTMGGRFFGRKAFASIQGSSMLLTAPMGLLAPVYAGWVYDSTGSYSSAFVLFLILALAAALLMCFVRAPRPPAEAGDIRSFL